MKKRTTKDKYMREYEKQFNDLFSIFEKHHAFMDSKQFSKLSEKHQAMETSIDNCTIDLLDILAMRITDYHASNKEQNRKLFEDIWLADASELDKGNARSALYTITKLLIASGPTSVVITNDEDGKNLIGFIDKSYGDNE